MGCSSRTVGPQKINLICLCKRVSEHKRSVNLAISSLVTKKSTKSIVFYLFFRFLYRKTYPIASDSNVRPRAKKQVKWARHAGPPSQVVQAKAGSVPSHAWCSSCLGGSHSVTHPSVAQPTDTRFKWGVHPAHQWTHAHSTCTHTDQHTIEHTVPHARTYCTACTNLCGRISSYVAEF